MSPPSTTKTLLLVGSGPGIGRHAAAQFASKGFTHIAMLSRNADRLRADAEFVRAAALDNAITVTTFPVDLTDQVALKTVLARLDKEAFGGEGGGPEVVLFNAARVEPSTLGETDEERVLDDFKTTTLALYTVSTWCLPHLVSLASSSSSSSTTTDKSTTTPHPTLILTGGGLHTHPLPAFFSLSLAKAAQFNLTSSLALIYGQEGVHVVTVNIGGQVSEDSEELSPKKVAEACWMVYAQQKDKWVEVVEVGDVVAFTEGMRYLRRLG